MIQVVVRGKFLILLIVLIVQIRPDPRKSRISTFMDSRNIVCICFACVYCFYVLKSVFGDMIVQLMVVFYNIFVGSWLIWKCCSYHFWIVSLNTIICLPFLLLYKFKRVSLYHIKIVKLKLLIVFLEHRIK